MLSSLGLLVSSGWFFFLFLSFFLSFFFFFWRRGGGGGGVVMLRETLYSLTNDEPVSHGFRIELELISNKVKGSEKTKYVGF